MSAGAAATVPEALTSRRGARRSEGTLGARRLVFDPATGEAIASVAQATSEDVDRAACLADDAYRGDWKRRTPKDRAAALFRLAAGIRDAADRPPRGWRAATPDTDRVGAREILLGADCFEYYAGAATKFGGATIQSRRGARRRRLPRSRSGSAADRALGTSRSPIATGRSPRLWRWATR